jgi:hypothetical protein
MVWIYYIVHRRCRKCKPFTSSFNPVGIPDDDEPGGVPDVPAAA